MGRKEGQTQLAPPMHKVQTSGSGLLNHRKQYNATYWLSAKMELCTWERASESEFRNLWKGHWGWRNNVKHIKMDCIKTRNSGEGVKGNGEENYRVLKWKMYFYCNG